MYTYSDLLDAPAIADGMWCEHPYVIVRTDCGYYTVFTEQCESEPTQFGPAPPVSHESYDDLLAEY